MEATLLELVPKSVLLDDVESKLSVLCLGADVFNFYTANVLEDYFDSFDVILLIINDEDLLTKLLAGMNLRRTSTSKNF